MRASQKYIYYPIGYFLTMQKLVFLRILMSLRGNLKHFKYTILMYKKQDNANETRAFSQLLFLNILRVYE